MAASRALLVDVADGTRTALERDGHAVTAAPTPAAAIERLAPRAWDLLVARVGDDERAALALVKRARALEGAPACVLIVPAQQRELGVRALREGARDFVVEPVVLDELRARARAAVTDRALVASLERPGRALRKTDVFVGASAQAEHVRAQVQAVARAPVPLLLLGESGTGKELVARMLHALSPRRDGPFVAVNCGAIPETLLENELFGHARGAYTGASGDTKGVFERADEGTLFLDEIGEMSPSLQVRLLRVIETGEFERLGDGRTIRVSARIVTATHRPLDRMVREGAFREDLYYRINVVAIRLPPLRERRDDIPLLAEHFRRLACSELGIAKLGFAPGALEAMAAHDWPGNARELANFVKRAVVMSPGDVVLAEGLATSARAATLDLARPFAELKRQTIEDFERAYLHQLLAKSHGNVAHAARASGQYPKNLWDLLKKHAIDPETYRAR